jgi:hypothetical protein
MYVAIVLVSTRKLRSIEEKQRGCVLFLPPAVQYAKSKLMKTLKPTLAAAA